MNIEGDFLDGKTPKRIRASLTINPGDHRVVEVTILAGPSTGLVIRFDRSQLKLESRLGNTPREIDLGEGALFVTTQHEKLDALLGSDSQSNTLLHKLESNVHVILFATFATVLTCWLSVAYGIPKIAEVIAYQLPDFSREQSEENLSLFDDLYFNPTSLTGERQEAIQILVQPYFDQHADLHPTLNFRSGMGANAFAMPNGDIVFTDDFVNLVENDEELLAVLFHELGHLKYKHVTRRALQGSMLTLLIVFITGDVNSVDILAGLPSVMLDLSFSRDFELEADYYALDQMWAAEIDLDHFAIVMQRLANQFDNTSEGELKNPESEADAGERFSPPDFLSTHPAVEDRVQMVEVYKASQGSP